MAFSRISLVSSKIPEFPLEAGSFTGACVDFRGIVRGLEKERPIRGILYTIHPRMTEPGMHALAAETCDRFPVLGGIFVHRTGFVAAGETSVFVRVLTTHRAEAYDASRWLLEQMKRCLPIWKEPLFE